MSAMDVVQLVTFILVFGMTFPWGLYCIHKTGDQRIELINWIFNTNDNQALMRRLDDFHKVSYERHAARMFFFQNPKKDYSNEIQESGVFK